MGHGLIEQGWETGPVSEASYALSSAGDLLVLVVEDTPVLSRTIGFLCDYLGFRVESVPSSANLPALLRGRRPIAVMSAIDVRWQDGCDVLKTVAEYNRCLPVLLVTGTEPALLGAVEAVEEVWQLRHVSKTTSMPGIGDLVEFLLKAGQGKSSSLMPA